MTVENITVSVTGKDTATFVLHPGDSLDLLVTNPNCEDLPFPDIPDAVLSGYFKGCFVGLDDDYYICVFGKYEHKKESDFYMINVNDIKDWGAG